MAFLSASAVATTAGAQGYAEWQIEPTSFTKSYNDSVAKVVAKYSNEDFENATRGKIAEWDNATLKSVGGHEYDTEAWAFLDGARPATVNPKIWRQSQLNKIGGLFEVVKGKIYQVRGGNLANSTYVRTKSGWVVIDAMSYNEVAADGLALLRKHVEDLPVKAVIITHSHSDHYGGLNGVIKGDTSIPVYAPEGFFQSSVNETVLAGLPMHRRASYMFAFSLETGERGSVGSGLGPNLRMKGRTSGTLREATEEIDKAETTIEIDGLKFDILLAPESEAPAELLVYIPQYKALCQAEDINHTFHNLLTPRGAKVRNGLLWSKYIDRLIEKYGDKVEVSFGSHHWPVWGRDKVVELWEKQRDLYRYTHDQTLRLANAGLTPNEIGNEIRFPETLGEYTANGEYYGTLSFNARSQYELYYGFFDGTPVHMYPLSPVEESKKYVEAIGGEQAVISKAKAAYDKGEYKWAATLLNNVVFANPQNKEARKALAAAFAQLGYQQVSAPGRNFYLNGAKELLEPTKGGHGARTTNIRVNENLKPEMFFDIVATRINGLKAGDLDISVNISIKDRKEDIALTLKNGVLSNRPGKRHKSATVSVSGDLLQVYTLFAEPKTLAEAVDSKKVTISGDKEALQKIFDVYENPDPAFNIIEP